ncbi:hypothetical protein K505DRAFT_358648 [Melanomma pulvis-pyrius CBS 109.77]|uniref:Uncharacterized protein n=1 Tax=Melanomma pulvis-pyrius CBS 109.77 TaxID=1314802 RepID=A0A6A6XKR2_9PLEO|nr:hypothetical protein K505DRAFT_358648 [Melanomma pulvis-pyrius CBS 109.77]
MSQLTSDNKRDGLKTGPPTFLIKSSQGQAPPSFPAPDTMLVEVSQSLPDVISRPESCQSHAEKQTHEASFTISLNRAYCASPPAAPAPTVPTTQQIKTAGNVLIAGRRHMPLPKHGGLTSPWSAGRGMEPDVGRPGDWKYRLQKAQESSRGFLLQAVLQ